jgi:hypothetical protein
VSYTIAAVLYVLLIAYVFIGIPVGLWLLSRPVKPRNTRRSGMNPSAYLDELDRRHAYWYDQYGSYADGIDFEGRDDEDIEQEIWGRIEDDEGYFGEGGGR